MTVYRLTSAVRVAAPRDQVFAFFARAENLESMTPPWLTFRIETPTPIAMGEGTTIDYRLRLHGVPLRWRSEITTWQPPWRFVDEQVRGPYRLWHHEHRLFEDGSDTLCEDVVHFAMPFGRLVVPLFVRRDLKRIFSFRRQRLIEHFGAGRGERHEAPAAIALRLAAPAPS